MKPPRIISRLDIKNENVVKGYQLEGWKTVGDPVKLAKKYYEDGVDEIVVLDSVASLFSRNKTLDIIDKCCNNIFIPIAVGGGIKSISDAREILEAGADKIVINTAFVKNRNLIKEFVHIFGSQSIVLSIQAKKIKDNWYVFSESGRENSGISVLDWISEAEQKGIGEILITFIDSEGLGKGFDIDLISKVKNITNLPIIIGGGFLKVDHLLKVKHFNVSGVSIAQAFHNNLITANIIKNQYILNE